MIFDRLRSAHHEIAKVWAKSGSQSQAIAYVPSGRATCPPCWGRRMVSRALPRAARLTFSVRPETLLRSPANSKTDGQLERRQAAGRCRACACGRSARAGRRSLDEIRRRRPNESHRQGHQRKRPVARKARVATPWRDLVGTTCSMAVAAPTRLYGGAGNDRLFGGPGDDKLAGGPGNDPAPAAERDVTSSTPAPPAASAATARSSIARELRRQGLRPAATAAT